MSAPLKTIDGRDYAFGRIPPTRSVPLQVKLAKLLGPEVELLLAQEQGAIAKLIADVTAAPDQATKLTIIGGAMRQMLPFLIGIIQSADGDEILKMMEVVFQYTNVGGHAISPETIDATFGGEKSNPATMWKVFFEGLRVNFAGFFPDVPLDSPVSMKT